MQISLEVQKFMPTSISPPNTSIHSHGIVIIFMHILQMLLRLRLLLPEQAETLHYLYNRFMCHYITWWLSWWFILSNKYINSRSNFHAFVNTDQVVHVRSSANLYSQIKIRLSILYLKKKNDFQFNITASLASQKLPIMHYDNRTGHLVSSTPDCKCNVYEIDEKWNGQPLTSCFWHNQITRILKQIINRNFKSPG